MRAERVDAVLPVVTKLIRLPVEYQLKTGIDKKIILFTAPEVCSCNFSVFAEYLWSSPLAPRGAEGASHSDDSARCLLGRRGMTSHWLIDILCSGLAGSLNINHRGKVIHSGFRWRRAKTSNYPIPSLPAGLMPVLMRRAADLLTAHRFFFFRVINLWSSRALTVLCMQKESLITLRSELRSLHWILIFDYTSSCRCFAALGHTIVYLVQTSKAWLRTLFFFPARAAAGGNSNHKSGVNTQFRVVLLFGAREFQILPDIPSYRTLSDTEGVRIGKSQHLSWKHVSGRRLFYDCKSNFFFQKSSVLIIKIPSAAPPSFYLLHYNNSRASS